MMGYGKMTVKCTDGKVRLCRIPGRFRNRLWIRVNNIVLVKPWELAEDERGDIIYRYSRAQAQWLEKKKKIRL
jgi:translation initiation factor 1A